MKIGDVSEKLGIPASTIRYYEQIGLIERQHRVSGRRDFDKQALFILQFVKLAQTAGFSINEAKFLIDSYVSDPSNKGSWKELAERKRQDVGEQIKSLKRIDSILNEVLSCRCASLTECIETGIKKQLS